VCIRLRSDRNAFTRIKKRGGGEGRKKKEQKGKEEKKRKKKNLQFHLLRDSSFRNGDCLIDLSFFFSSCPLLEIHLSFAAERKVAFKEIDRERERQRERQREGERERERERPSFTFGVRGATV